MLFSFQVERIAPTILEAINKIGSMVNGPLLALFVLALLAPAASGTAAKSRQAAALRGFAAGLLVNFCLWQFFPHVSWLWWNLSGFLTALLVAGMRLPEGWRAALGRPLALHTYLLLGMTLVIVAVCVGLQLL